MYEGVGVYIHVFLTSALVGGECSASLLGRYTPAERAPGTHWIGGWGGLRNRSGRHREEKNLAPTGTRTPTPSAVLPVASRYTDCAIQAHILRWNLREKQMRSHSYALILCIMLKETASITNTKIISEGPVSPTHWTHSVCNSNVGKWKVISKLRCGWIFFECSFLSTDELKTRMTQMCVCVSSPQVDDWWPGCVSPHPCNKRRISRGKDKRETCDFIRSR
jgi:hypothetical protein